MGVSTASYIKLYSWYSWPNVILSLFGGYLIDKAFGVRLGAIIFLLFICAGQAIFAFGAFVNRFWLMKLGRFVFGIGGESLVVASNNFAVSWFKGKELNMVFGFTLSISRLGGTLNFQTMNPIYYFVQKYYTGYQCLGITLGIAGIFCLLSLLSGIILSLLDKRAKKLLSREDVGTGEEVRFSDILDFGQNFWLISFICVTYYTAIFSFIGIGA